MKSEFSTYLMAFHRLQLDAACPMSRHSCAHRRQAAAQSWQCCAWCLAHSSAQASQTSAHNWQICVACSVAQIARNIAKSSMLM
jgi:hypothetical protein